MRLMIAIAVLAVAAGLQPAAALAQSAASAPTQYVEVSGNRIAYRTLGSGAPLVLLNRMRGTLDTWDPLFLDALAQTNRIVTVDYPGVGYSSGTFPADMAAASAFVNAFATAISLKRVAVLGWSWGGLARLSHERIYTRPDVVSKIPATQGESQAFLKAGEGFRADAARRQQLTQSQIPMLILCGDNDPSVPTTNWYPLVGQNPRAQLVVLPESGHGPQHQYPELSAKYIRAFLQQHLN